MQHEEEDRVHPLVVLEQLLHDHHDAHHTDNVDDHDGERLGVPEDIRPKALHLAQSAKRLIDLWRNGTIQEVKGVCVWFGCACEDVGVWIWVWVWVCESTTNAFFFEFNQEVWT